jgi:hypothetical protein
MRHNEINGPQASMGMGMHAHLSKASCSLCREAARAIAQIAAIAPARAAFFFM